MDSLAHRDPTRMGTDKQVEIIKVPFWDGSAVIFFLSGGGLEAAMYLMTMGKTVGKWWFNGGLMVV